MRGERSTYSPPEFTNADATTEVAPAEHTEQTVVFDASQIRHVKSGS